jgi:hypothetical protein
VTFVNPFSIATRLADGWRSVKVDGRNINVAQAYVPISSGGFYRTPQASAAVSLRVRAGGNTGDTANGAGAREIEFYGIDANGMEVTDRVATAGASASAATTVQFMRLIEARVIASGTYATQSAGSHVADINIEDTAGNLWSVIPLNGFPEGRSRSGVFTVPDNYEAFLIGVRLNADAGKTVDAIVFQRNNILQTVAPYSPMVAISEYFNVGGFFDISYSAPIHLPPLTDVGVMARINNQTARVGCGLGLLLRRVK